MGDEYRHVKTVVTEVYEKVPKGGGGDEWWKSCLGCFVLLIILGVIGKACGH